MYLETPNIIVKIKTNIVKGINIFFFLSNIDARPKIIYRIANMPKKIKTNILIKVSIPFNSNKFLKKKT